MLVAWEQLFSKNLDANKNIDEQNKQPEIDELHYNIDLNNIEIEEVFVSGITIGITCGSKVVSSSSAENSVNERRIIN